MKIKERIKLIKLKSAQLYIAMKHVDTPWYAKVLGGLTIGYALSPIDLIPDFIPILGYLDDLIILPLLLGLCVKLIPKGIWESCEVEALKVWENGKPKKWYYAIPIVVIWGIAIYYLTVFLINIFS
ncbi:DUF1232 domain-containing protein [Mycoplasmatota bacterium WC30]